LKTQNFSVTDILLIIPYTLVLSAIIYRWRIFSLPGIRKWYIVTAFVIKICAGIALGLLYTHHYTDRSKADTFKFFDDSRVMMEALSNKPQHFLKLFTGIGLDDPELEPYFFKMNTWITEDFYVTSNRMMVRLNTIFRFLSPPGEHYFLHVVMFNFLSLLGLIFLCKSFFLNTKKFHFLIFLSLIFFPSLLFWGSGLLKDGIILFAAGCLIYSFVRITNGASHKALNSFVFLISALLLALIKIYILMAMIPSLVAWIWIAVKPGKTGLKFAVVHAIVFLLAFGFHFISPSIDPIHYFTLKQHQFLGIVQVEKPNHVLAIRPLENSAVNVIVEAVPAFSRVLLRPHLLESRQPLILMAAIENFLLLIIILFSLTSIKRGTWINNPLFYFSLAFFVLIYMLIGLIVPVTGAIVRYKIIALPFLLFILFSLLENSRAENFLRRFSA
jgi:hypothetical protein